MADKKLKLALIGVTLILGLIIFTLSHLFPIYAAYNNEYENISTKVNVTNAYPVIDFVTPDQNITLSGGTTKTIKCNVSLHDWNGFADIKNVNATFWDNNSVSFNSSDNPNNHYTNSTCLNVSQNGYNANYTCYFDVWYYANNGSNWLCNATVIDNYNFTATGQNSTTILPYYALNVTSVIDFGNMAVGDTKNNITANITNFGNRNINISVSGYGNKTNDGLAMVCFIRNITISNLKYTINESDWASGSSLASSATNISGLTVPKRTAGMVWNQTYWHLYIPPNENPFGVCNGTIVFTASIG